jgi:biotin carboxyl carrier protein
VEELMAASFVLNGRTHRVEIVARRPHLVLSVDGRLHAVRGHHRLPDGLPEDDGAPLAFAHARSDAAVAIRMDGTTHRLTWIDPRAAAAGHAAADDVIRAPMPGVVIAVHAAEGDTVAEGATVVTIESMKLQTALTAPRAGTIAELAVAEGATFDKDAVLVRLAPPEDDQA